MKIHSPKLKAMLDELCAVWMQVDPQLGGCSEVDELPQMGTIYFLCNEDDEILYIGQTKNLLIRACQHRSSEKMRKKAPDWVKTWYIQTPLGNESTRLKYEAILILLVSPPINQALMLKKNKAMQWRAIRWRRKRRWRS